VHQRPPTSIKHKKSPQIFNLRVIYFYIPIVHYVFFTLLKIGVSTNDQMLISVLNTFKYAQSGKKIKNTRLHNQFLGYI
jgi:hypothetical protein